MFRANTGFALKRKEPQGKQAVFWNKYIALWSNQRSCMGITRFTVPVKCKLTVTWNLNELTWSSILGTWKLWVLSLELSRSRFESSPLRFESRRQRIYRLINFSKYMYMSILLVYFWRQRNFQVATLQAVSDSTFVNQFANLNWLFCPSVELLSLWS